jgi:hypothetical protein
MRPESPPPPSTTPREEEEMPPFVQHVCLGFFAVLIAPVCVVVAPFALLGWVIEKIGNYERPRIIDPGNPPMPPGGWTPNPKGEDEGGKTQ